MDDWERQLDDNRREAMKQHENDEELIVVCGRYDPDRPDLYRLTFPDNKIGTCSSCDGQVEHRPYVPETATLLCVRCFIAKRRAGELDDHEVR